MAKSVIIILILLCIILYGIIFLLPQKTNENAALQAKVDSLTIISQEQAKDVADSKQETLEIEARLKLKEDFYPSIETKYVKIHIDLMRLDADSSIRILADNLGRIPVSKYP